MQSSSNNSVGYTKLFDENSVFNSSSVLRMHRVKLKRPYMVHSYHQKTFTILKSNVMLKMNVKILQWKHNIWKGNYKNCIEQCLLKKWQLLITICCLKNI